MFEVTCPSARFGTHRENYQRHQNRDLITMKINKGGLSAEIEMTVEEADKLAAELLDWTKEIKEERPYA